MSEPVAALPPGARTRARRTALQALYQWQLTSQEPDDIARQFLDERPLEKVDIGYFGELVRGIPSHLQALDALLDPALDRPLDRVDPVERAILRIGAYELAFRPDIPWRVAVNEAVEIAKAFGADQSYKYVNGILDKVARTARPDAARDRPGRKKASR